MTVSLFNHVRLLGIKTVIPEHFIDIDDELQYFDNNPKKLARAKKMMGYGRRYIADENTTVTDMAIDAAEKLFSEMNVDRNEIDLLVFVNQKPDYSEPCDACIAHGRLNLKKSCASININMGCSGWLYGLSAASGIMQGGGVKKCLVLAGDKATHKTKTENRKGAPVFSDAASATVLEYVQDDVKSVFVLGSDGTGWDKIIRPFGGVRLPFEKDNIDLSVTDDKGNVYTCQQGIMQGEDVFNFTMEVAPALLNETMETANWTSEEVDLFAIHQANKQILENIIFKAGIPPEKVPVDVFSKYANNSTNSVVTVLCDQPKDTALNKVVLCTFGIGLSWSGAALDLSGMYNGGISTYVSPKDRPTRAEQIQHWINYFKGEEK